MAAQREPDYPGQPRGGALANLLLPDPSPPYRQAPASQLRGRATQRPVRYPSKGWMRMRRSLCTCKLSFHFHINTEKIPKLFESVQLCSRKIQKS